MQKIIELVPLKKRSLSSIARGEHPIMAGYVPEEGWPSEELIEAASILYNDKVHGGYEEPVGAWGVVISSTKKVIGDVGLVPSAETEGTLKMGYTIVPSMRGKGYGNLAVKTLLEEMEVGPWRVIAEVTSSNISSRKVLANNGFERVDLKGGIEIWEYRRR